MARRGNGEGSVYRAAAGRWRAQVDLGWRDGKRRRKYLSGATKAEVTSKLRAAHRAVEDGIALPTDGRAPTVEQWFAYYFDHIAAGKIGVRTLADYRSTASNHIYPVIGNVRLDKLQPEHLESVYSRIDGPSTRIKTHRIASRALKVAVQRGKIPRNVATLIDAPSAPRAKPKSLTRDDARRVLALAGGRRNGTRWSIALALGLRQGEALGLLWDAVNLDEGYIEVRRQLQRHAGVGLVLVEKTKTKSSHRSIPLTEQMVEQLREHRKGQRAERLAAHSWTPTDYVFTDTKGGPIDPRNDYRLWVQLLADAGVPPLKLHGARHTAATLLLTQRVPARVVMEILGHSSITLTMDTYTEVPTEVARDAADRLTDALWG